MVNREILGRSLSILTVVSIGISASYGVYKYSLYFAPQWVALMSSFAFELLFITLAVMKDNRWWVGALAVTSSVIYNTLAGVMNETDIYSLPFWLLFALSFIHAITLSPLAYFFLHSSFAPDVSDHASASVYNENESDSTSVCRENTSNSDSTSVYRESDNVERDTDIIEQKKSGVSTKELAITYGLSQQRVRQIVRGNTKRKKNNANY